ncbi:hypothetical protein BD309DRAFT_863355 [Dichomitus squalens]|uniref:Uncharacterized protein n=2 Tax=Dichomitus squalens TaxID=114155 RepID=A0A4Q9NUU6_9APHY|nr:uncharacterized protein DICSQDRAFT_173423 [Dichomitus squalens LYAD-421 SS1]EJF57929.1 hypothetical protein DICSQDRAFT_173423 [Dichomitus squalens LYAD-421 SS1]TBU25625.1 hypothetical protein BD311DRAFT_493889 [Dichomitus squalens]TBU43892.1 hypothetical protein BD309DRAFT_863355 [Dichomitus squalens]TBU60453.1 hypothetical protein BD310DRAFT_333300 [Dichomitus squalens]
MSTPDNNLTGDTEPRQLETEATPTDLQDAGRDRTDDNTAPDRNVKPAPQSSGSTKSTLESDSTPESPTSDDDDDFIRRGKVTHTAVGGGKTGGRPR